MNYNDWPTSSHSLDVKSDEGSFPLISKLGFLRPRPMAVSQKKRASNQGRSGSPRQGALKTYPGRRPFRGAAFKALLFNSKLGSFPESSVLTHTRQSMLSPARKPGPASQSYTVPWPLERLDAWRDESLPCLHPIMRFVLRSVLAWAGPARWCRFWGKVGIRVTNRDFLIAFSGRSRLFDRVKADSVQIEGRKHGLSHSDGDRMFRQDGGLRSRVPTNKEYAKRMRAPSRW